MTTGKNPLIQSTIVDTLCYVENHLRFINDYFSAKQYDQDSSEDPRVIHGLCNTLDMSIEALRYEINRDNGKIIAIMNVLNEDKEGDSEGFCDEKRYQMAA